VYRENNYLFVYHKLPAGQDGIYRVRRGIEELTDVRKCLGADA
jgi:hypothetical protein